MTRKGDTPTFGSFIKKGSSNTLWILMVAIVAIFLVITMIYMTQNKTSSFSSIFSDMFGDVQSGFQGLSFGNDQPGTVKTDKNVIEWMAEKSGLLCSGDLSKKVVKEYTFSKNIVDLKIVSKNDEDNITGKWAREGDDITYTKLVKNCDDLLISGDSLKGEKKLRIILEPIKDSGTSKKANKVNIKLFDKSKTHNKLPIAKLKLGKDDNIKPMERNFSAKGSKDTDGKITKYEWDIDNDDRFEETGGPYLIHKFKKEGKHTVQLKITDDNGAWKKTSLDFKIDLAEPNPEIKCEKKDGGDWKDARKVNIYPGDIIKCDGSESNTKEGEIVDYHWTISPKEARTISEIGKSIKFQIDKDNNINVDLKVVSEIGGKNKEAEESKEISVKSTNPKAQIDYSPDQPKAGEEITLDASNSLRSKSNAKITDYKWEIISGPDSFSIEDERSEKAELTTSSSKNPTVKVTVTDQLGATDTTEKTIEVGPAPSFEYEVDYKEEEDHWEVKLDTKDTEKLSNFQWSFEDNAESPKKEEGKSVEKIFNNEGGKVTLTARDSEGDEGSREKNLDESKFRGIKMISPRDANALGSWWIQDPTPLICVPCDHRTDLRFFLKEIYRETEIDDLRANATITKCCDKKATCNNDEKFHEQKFRIKYEAGPGDWRYRYKNFCDQMDGYMSEFKIIVKGKVNGKDVEWPFCLQCEADEDSYCNYHPKETPEGEDCEFS